MLLPTSSLPAKPLPAHYSEVNERIKEDIERTFSEVPLFSSFCKGRLLTLLQEYSKNDTEIGYCQGMNYLAGLLIFFISDDELALRAFSALMSYWRELYIKGMPKLFDLLEQLNSQMSEIIPEVHQHLTKHEIQLNGLFSHVFLTAFTYHVPFPLAVKIFDLFLLDGESALINCVLNMLKLMKERIMEKSNEEIHKYIKEEMVKKLEEEHQN